MAAKRETIATNGITKNGSDPGLVRLQDIDVDFNVISVDAADGTDESLIRNEFLRAVGSRDHARISLLLDGVRMKDGKVKKVILHEAFLLKKDLLFLYSQIIIGYDLEVYDKIIKILKSDQQDASYIQNALDGLGWLTDSLLLNLSLELYEGAGKYVKHPSSALFIMSLICNDKKMADIFLRNGTSPIACCLVGAILLRGLAKNANDTNEYQLEGKFLESAKFYESLATKMIDLCYEKDSIKAIQLVIRQLPEWNKTTLLSIADCTESIDFMSTAACQTRLTQIWNSYFKFSATRQHKYILGIIFPCLLLGERNKAVGRENVDDEEVDPWYPTGKNIFHRGYGDGRWGFLTPLVFYYPTPRVKMYCHSISYIIYLLLFGYYVNTSLGPMEKQNVGILGYIIWFWSFSIGMDEIRQMFGRRPQYTKSTWRYITSGWNWLDIAVILLMIVSVVLHYTLPEEHFSWTRGCYVLTLYISMLRILLIFYASRYIGPLVITIRDMLKDLLSFLVVLLVFILAYAVSVRALKYPNVAPSWKLIINIIYEPYWNIFGELFENDGEILSGTAEEGCTHNETLHRERPDLYPRCPEHSWLGVLLMAFYMVVTNVLLLNLLIAILSNTYAKIESKSEKIWNFYRHHLVYEYYEKPSLVPPLIIFGHIEGFIRFLLRKFTKYLDDRVTWKNTPFCRDLSHLHENHPSSNKNLTEFEREALSEILQEAEKTKKRNANEVSIEERLDKMEKILLNMQQHLSKDGEYTSQKHSSRLTYI